MTAKELKNRIVKMNSHVLFDYKNCNCGIDPITSNQFTMWFGTTTMTAGDIEEVMTLKLFDGASLTDIASEIEIYE